LPAVFHNGTDHVVTSETITVQPGQLAYHPGSSGQFSVVRFTAPNDGAYSLASAFSPVDSLATTDVHVLLNNVSVFDGAVQGPSTSASVDHQFTLHTGDTLDFKVGYGSNHNFLNDSTGLSAVLTLSVPEPSGFVTLGFGLLGLLWARLVLRK